VRLLHRAGRQRGGVGLSLPRRVRRRRRARHRRGPCRWRSLHPVQEAFIEAGRLLHARIRADDDAAVGRASRPKRRPDPWIARIGEAASQPTGQPDHTVGGAEKQRTGVRRHASAVERGHHRAPFNACKLKQARITLCRHRETPLLSVRPLFEEELSPIQRPGAPTLCEKSGLTSDDLISIGVTSVGHRRKLLAVVALLGGAPPAATMMEATRDTQAPADAERRQLTVMFLGSVLSSTRPIGWSRRARCAAPIAGCGQGSRLIMRAKSASPSWMPASRAGSPMSPTPTAGGCAAMSSTVSSSALARIGARSRRRQARYG
jgi:hypothetical protein